MSDWTSDAADTVERTVALVRERTVDPVRAITKGVVYGGLAALLIVPALAFVTIAAFRLLVAAFQGEVWGAWSALGGIFLAVGGFLWAKREA